VRGGASDASIIEKQVAAERMAYELRLPLVRLVEGSGGGGSVKSLEDLGYTYVPYLPGWDLMTQNLATVPVVSLGLGPVAGFGAAKVVASHYSLLVRGLSQMFVAGPPVVAAVGQTVTKEELGSSQHTRRQWRGRRRGRERKRGLRARASFPLLPAVVGVRAATAWPATRRPGASRGLADRRSATRPSPGVPDAADHRGRGRRRQLLRDRPLHGRSVITGLARLDGWPVAIVASDPFVVGGLWTAASSAKLERFVSFAETFHLPVVHLVDNPGFNIGRQAELEGTIRAGARGARLDLPGYGAVVHGDRAQGVRRRRRRSRKPHALPPSLCLAVGRLGLPADRGRHRGGLQGRARGGAGSRGRRSSRYASG
jgi:hypothetical protein